LKALVGFGLPLTLVAYILRSVDINSFIGSILMFFAIALTVTLCWTLREIVTDNSIGNNFRRISIKIIGAYGGIAAIDTLASADWEYGVWNNAGPTLYHLFGRLTVDDYGKLSPISIDVMASALHPLGTRDQGVWIPLVLDSLEKVGTGACVPAVQGMAKRGQKAEWKEHAARVLPILMERQRVEKDSSRLLRASEFDKQSDSLLRPMEPGHLNVGTNLLHAISVPQNDACPNRKLE